MERVLTVKANYLSEKYGYDVIIVTTSQNGRKPFYKPSEKVKIVDLGIDYEKIQRQPLLRRIMSRLNAKLSHRQKLTDLLFQLKPDVTVSMFTHEMSFLPDIQDGSRKVLELHFSKHFRSLDAKSNGASCIIRAINSVLDWKDRKAVQKYDRFVVLTHQDAEDWRKDKNTDNVSVISNPASFAPSDDEITDYSAKRVLAIGRLCPQKGFDILIDAWRQIPAKVRSGWSLDIVGSGPDKKKLADAIAAGGLENEIQIIPPVKDVAQLYKNHSIFCFPSRYEGFGLSLMEAMSFGLACVGSNCPCGPGELIENQSVGLLIPTESPQSLAQALQSLMGSESLRCRIGQAARLSIQERYSLETTMGKWDKLFTSLLNQ